MERITITDFEFQGKHPYISAFTIQGKVQIHIDLTPMKIVNPEIYNFYWVDGRLQWWVNGVEWKNEKAKVLADAFGTYLNLNPQKLAALTHNR